MSSTARPSDVLLAYGSKFSGLRPRASARATGGGSRAASYDGYDDDFETVLDKMQLRLHAVGSATGGAGPASLSAAVVEFDTADSDSDDELDNDTSSDGSGHLDGPETADSDAAPRHGEMDETMCEHDTFGRMHGADDARIGGTFDGAYDDGTYDDGTYDGAYDDGTYDDGTYDGTHDDGAYDDGTYDGAYDDGTYDGTYDGGAYDDTLQAAQGVGNIMANVVGTAAISNAEIAVVSAVENAVVSDVVAGIVSYTPRHLDKL